MERYQPVSDSTELDIQSVMTTLPDLDDLEKVKNFFSVNGNELTFEALPFRENDSLGSSIVPTVIQKSQAKSEYHARYLGSQAHFLVSPQDRIIALQHLTSSIQILLSRSIILNILSFLSLNASSLNLLKSLDVIGLSDIRKVVRLMTLTAMNRIEISAINSQNDYISSPLTKSFSQLMTQITPTASACLNNLSVCIAALAQNDAEASKMVVNMCTKDLMCCAVKLGVSRSAFAVTQALVGILASHGGCSLLDLPKEDISLSPGASNNSPFTLVNALSAYVISKRVSNANREWAAQQLFKCIATKFQIFSSSNSEQVNFADLSNSLGRYNCINLDGHENRVSVLAFNETLNLLASAGYDGTVRIWSVDKKQQPFLEHTFVFHKSLEVYGCELQDKLIGHLKWSPTGSYIAAAMENIINIWPISFHNTEKHQAAKKWFIEDQQEFVTCLSWPKFKREDSGKEHLLVGKVDGTVSLITIEAEVKVVEILMNCCLTQSKFLLVLYKMFSPLC